MNGWRRSRVDEPVDAANERNDGFGWQVASRYVVLPWCELRSSAGRCVLFVPSAQSELFMGTCSNDSFNVLRRQASAAPAIRYDVVWAWAALDGFGMSLFWFWLSVAIFLHSNTKPHRPARAMAPRAPPASSLISSPLNS